MCSNLHWIFFALGGLGCLVILAMVLEGIFGSNGYSDPYDY